MRAKIPASELKEIPFPNCARICAAIGYLGTGECESVCPEKFNKKGKQ
jgi:hypothetical protein